MLNIIQNINLSKCKSVLQKDGSVYSDDEVLKIKNFLVQLAEMDYTIFLKLKLRELEFEKQKQKDQKLKEAA